jgi:hypothetical protein
VEVHKQFVGKKPNTKAQITKKGLAAIQRHWDQLDAIRKNADVWEDNATKDAK